jgi:3-deoxy-D-manno-octulosonic-acid transferase
MTALWAAYRVLAPCLGALAPAARVLAPPEEKGLWRERLGYVRVPGGVHAWVHGASLGEALAVAPLVKELAALQPRARFHLTATSRSGRTRLSELGATASLAPLDAPQAVRRFFDGVEPQRLFIVETELWPHWLLHAHASGIPVAIVSARLSERSVGRYRRLGAGLRQLVAGLSGVLCQTPADLERWRTLGAPAERTAVVGNLKADALPEPVPDRARARAALGLDPERPLLVLGSLRPGEPAAVARGWRALPATMRDRWQVVAVPRHPRASAELRLEATHAGQALVTQGAPGRGAWRWDDRLGVLARYYAACDAALVGGSIMPYDGHNPLEPAAMGAPVLMGPHHASQADAVATLAAHGGLRVVRGTEELSEALGEWLGNDEARARAAAGARAAVQAQRGAARRATRRLVEWNLWPVD